MNPNLDALIESIKGRKSTQVDGSHLRAGIETLKGEGFKKQEDINFNAVGALKGEILFHPKEKLRADISSGNFMGSFTELFFSPMREGK